MKNQYPNKRNHCIQASKLLASPSLTRQEPWKQEDPDRTLVDT